MKKLWIIIGTVVIILAIVLGVYFYYMNIPKEDERCSMSPIYDGDCEMLKGFYYNSITNTCESVVGCSADIPAPFDVTERDLCESLCIKK